MKLLVTGGLGFIGCNFVADALGRREVSKVVNIDSMSLGSNLQNQEQHGKNLKYTFIKGDITNRRLLSRLVSDSDVIVNFAAETHVDRSISDPRPFMKSNVEGVLSILESMRAKAEAAVLVQVGTDEVYGDLLDGSADESSLMRPSSPYSATKAAADMLCLAYHRTYGLRTMITRCTNNFGPFQSPEKFIPKAIIRAQRGLKIPLYGDGRSKRDWIHVADHCEALRAVIKSGKPGDIYNVAGGKELENVELARMILEIMGKPKSLIEFVGDRPGHDRRYSLDDQKTREELGWRPKRLFEEALKSTVQWYLKNESWWHGIADKKALSPEPWKLRWRK